MNLLRKYLGLVWMLLGPAIILFLVISAAQNIGGESKSDISKPVPWLIIILIFTPIAAGLMVFGWYAYRGEYDKTDVVAFDES